MWRSMQKKPIEANDSGGWSMETLWPSWQQQNGLASSFRSDTSKTKVWWWPWHQKRADVARQVLGCGIPASIPHRSLSAGPARSKKIVLSLQHVCQKPCVCQKQCAKIGLISVRKGENSQNIQLILSIRKVTKQNTFLSRHIQEVAWRRTRQWQNEEITKQLLKDMVLLFSAAEEESACWQSLRLPCTSIGMSCRLLEVSTKLDFLLLLCGWVGLISYTRMDRTVQHKSRKELVHFPTNFRVLSNRFSAFCFFFWLHLKWRVLLRTCGKRGNWRSAKTARVCAHPLQHRKRSPQGSTSQKGNWVEVGFVPRGKTSHSTLALKWEHKKAWLSGEERPLFSSVFTAPQKNVWWQCLQCGCNVLLAPLQFYSCEFPVRDLVCHNWFTV